jgi:hypothetical protein
MIPDQIVVHRPLLHELPSLIHRHGLCSVQSRASLQLLVIVIGLPDAIARVSWFSTFKYIDTVDRYLDKRVACRRPVQTCVSVSAVLCVGNIVASSSLDMASAAHDMARFHEPPPNQ